MGGNDWVCNGINFVLVQWIIEGVSKKDNERNIRVFPVESLTVAALQTAVEAHFSTLNLKLKSKPNPQFRSFLQDGTELVADPGVGLEMGRTYFVNVQRDSSVTSEDQGDVVVVSSAEKVSAAISADRLAAASPQLPSVAGNPAADNGRDRIEIPELAEAFQSYSHRVDNCKGIKSVVLFGETGSGKTSTTLFFLGARMVTKECSPSYLYDGSIDDSVGSATLDVADEFSSLLENIANN